MEELNISLINDFMVVNVESTYTLRFTKLKPLRAQHPKTVSKSCKHFMKKL